MVFEPALGTLGPVRAIGLMSGTSADGVDAIMVEISDPSVREPPLVLAHAYVPFEPDVRAVLTDPLALDVATLARLHFELPRLYADVVEQLADWKTADVVGMHGQTIWHAPPSQRPAVPTTLQIGSSGALATRLRLPVVGDFRSADVARGGEGAPIMPLPHWFFTPASDEPTLVVNVGGIANYTYVTNELDDVRASDLGPGMMITDALAVTMTDGEALFDEDGTLSRDGRIEPRVVEFIASHDFFTRPTPRSTGREDFGRGYVDELLSRFEDADPKDLIRSSIAATAHAIAHAATDDVGTVGKIIVTGGGANHPRLIEDLRLLMGATPVEVAADGPLAPSHHEPAGMALIAARTRARLPSSLPAVTGAQSASILGHVHEPP